MISVRWYSWCLLLTMVFTVKIALITLKRQEQISCRRDSKSFVLRKINEE